ncbi:high frequency lysogenization protein HflD [Marinobacter koreensis]|jgi:high frequency lysogenization protein|uniref:High frequency lysogenization protein HflD homolog n=1 Tax=Marinobacter koreensis TaxID=335974 RepID=A0ABW0RMA6_9GAMM|nr:high frequency lysogenization protein HflD [Marinobacter koreensis]MCK7547323.1 high frequency lysogenization protein HflD [Marinobacter koreensis]MDX1818638.1 high frequency lysogenization protein HflD [Marinobacter sp.]
MSRSLHDQTLALAGLFQASALVQQIAHRGQCNEASLETSIRSLFATNPETTLDVFGGELTDIREGLETLAAIMGQQSKPEDVEILRYTLNLVHLEAKLRRHRDMLDVIGSRIDQARHTASHFGYTHPNLIGNLASVYTDTISTFRQRIQVTGNPTVLQREENAAKVRALLLAGIRSAVLWHQCGGRRWQLLFVRRKIIQHARELAEQSRQLP